MDRRIQWIVCAILIAGLSGCCNCRRGLGLFSNINSARISAPTTGSVQFPQVASSYYNSNQAAASTQPTINTQQGWRPAAATQSQSPQTNFYNPTSYSVPNVAAVGTIPANNRSAASSTSTLRQAQLPYFPAGNAGMPVNSTAPLQTPASAGGGMPLTDATRLAAPGVSVGGPNNFAANRTWEYVARPTAPQLVQPQQMASGNSVIATSSTMPSFAGPRFGQGSANTYSSTAANGWRQRDANGVSR